MRTYTTTKTRTVQAQYSRIWECWQLLVSVTYNGVPSVDTINLPSLTDAELDRTKAENFASIFSTIQTF